MIRRPCRFLLGFVCFLSLVFAQDRGTISGSITDNSGAIVPGAKVTLQNPATGFTQNMISTADGVYSFLYLASGRYTVTAEKEGFRKAEIAEVQVQVNTTSRVDIRLQVGALQEVVEVQVSPHCCRLIAATSAGLWTTKPFSNCLCSSTVDCAATWPSRS